MIIADEKDAQLIEFMIRSRTLNRAEIRALWFWLNDTIGIDAESVVHWLQEKT